MKIIEVQNYDEMSKKAAQFILDKVRSADSVVLGLVTSGTPIGTYQHLVKDYEENQTSY